MASAWTTTKLRSELEVFDALADLKRRVWLSRGQSKVYCSLIPSIDRPPLTRLSRRDKLQRERSGIDLFRSTAHFFADDGERYALRDDIVALMVLRHYEAPTRLLDWSISPYVAAYFAVHDHDSKAGELWSFDEAHYAVNGKKQWIKWPETTTDGSGNDAKFDANLTAFLPSDRPDWIIVGYYEPGFPRQQAQWGRFTMTAQFQRDHAQSLQELLDDGSKHCRYIIPAHLKATIRQRLHRDHGVWRGALYPDSAGAAETAGCAIRGARIV
jgi:hypothetical protein